MGLAALAVPVPETEWSMDKMALAEIGWDCCVFVCGGGHMAMHFRRSKYRKQT